MLNYDNKMIMISINCHTALEKKLIPAEGFVIGPQQCEGGGIRQLQVKEQLTAEVLMSYTDLQCRIRFE